MYLRLSKLWLPAVISLLLLETFAEESDIMPLDQVKPGLRGVWRTVVSGTDIEEFEMKVLGVAQNFVGPQRAIIICEALDPENIVSGPVAGMSGSPVYIGGKLIGAYAYGFTWPKEQAIFGVTPIQHMLEVLEDYPIEPVKPKRQPRPRGFPMEPLGKKEDSSSTGNWKIISGNLNSGQTEVLLKPLPTPLMVSGLSKRALQAFNPQIEKMGLSFTHVPVGRTMPGTELTLEPGAPLSAVLLSGDFSIAATGTVTYRNGDTLLGFGHPFFQMGQSEIPMAGAEVITVVRSLNQSFKLFNSGPVIGSIYQDRLTGIAGKIGPMPPLTKVLINTRAANGIERQYSGELFEHPYLSPIFASVALLDSLYSTLESSEEQTFYLDGEIGIEGYDPITFHDVSSGPNGAFETARKFFDNYSRLVANPFSKVHINDLRFNISMDDTWKLSVLKAVQVENQRVRAGDSIDLTLTFYNYQDEQSRHKVSLPVPAGLQSGEKLTVLIADAREVERLEGMQEIDAASLDEIVEQLRRGRSGQNVYLKLLRKAPGLRIEGANLYDLPPSIRTIYTSAGNNISRRTIEEVSIWETQISVPGEFRGSYRVSITLE